MFYYIDINKDNYRNNNNDNNCPLFSFCSLIQQKKIFKLSEHVER